MVVKHKGMVELVVELVLESDFDLLMQDCMGLQQHYLGTRPELKVMVLGLYYFEIVVTVLLQCCIVIQHCISCMCAQM